MKNKIKAKNEIILLDKFETNFECGFLIYKLKKIINNNDTNNSFKIKDTSKKIKSIIENILNNYISFWNIILVNDWNKSNNFNFISMNNLVEEIKLLNNKLNENIKSLDSWDLLDQETIKIYFQYLKEILNHNEKANLFKNRISLEKINKHQYDETNLFELDYKEMAKNEDYQYLIINLTKNKIINSSFSICKIFAYKKEELIGSPLDKLFPDIFNSERKKFLKSKIEDYKKKVLIKNNKINLETWIDNNFAIDKNKFLIEVKFKWFITSLEDQQIYGILNLYPENKKILNDNEQEIVNVLTDKNLVIQNFSSNAIKILKLNQNDLNNNCNIIKYISELNENLIQEYESKIDKEDSNINSNIKHKNSKRNKKYIKSDIMKKFTNYLEKNQNKVIHWKIEEKIKFNNNLKNSILDNNNDISSLSS